ncbi:Di-copper centre-containing protein [Canariomyces notabilis]|uniref:tyrosinase n=1 Tax=Canariomyces notabilis TaxID=2074819 RepID=A0AAN6TAP9_9PEZI|nr:Di-copper centre-containing protein [Canariomyces arenarius]
MATPIPTIGVASITASIRERKEVRDLKEDTVMWELFLLGLLKFQKDAKEHTSYYDIACIHGAPWDVAWNGVDRKLMGKSGKKSGGYCSHSSNLFATWHRPYVALFEAKLYKHVQDEAERLQRETHRLDLLEKARGFRLPYWDWGVKSGKNAQEGRFPLAIFGEKNIRITIDPKQHEIRNPLAAFYRFEIPGSQEIAARMNLDPFKSEEFTLRYPGPPPKLASQNSEVQRALDNIGPIGSQISGLFAVKANRGESELTPELDFNVFATNKMVGSGAAHYPSLESLHDTIHIIVGSGGHMNIQAYAAFDPIFWLHHCNVDRLLAIYQALYPKNWIKEWKAAGNAAGTFTTDFGDAQNGSTKLYPFWDKSGKLDSFWTSDGVRLTTTLGYTYPETSDTVRQQQGTNYTTWLRRRISELYPVPSQMRRRIRATEAPVSFMAVQPEPILKIDNPGEDNLASEGISVTGIAAETTSEAITTAESSKPEYDESTFTLWTANMRAEKHVLGQPYSVYIFLRDFPADPATWDLNPTTVGLVAILGQSQDTGCAKCVTDMAEGLCVTGTVSLTEALVDAYNLDDGNEERLTSLDNDDVANYLKRHLHWRVLLADKTEVPRDQVPGLMVCVSAVKVTLDEDGLPVYDPDHRVYYRVTDGRPAGLNRGDEV